MDLIILLFVFVLGLFVGSFLNVCICRLPKNESVIFPSSHCPKCKHSLAVPDLFPVLSYVFLRAKCRYCGDRISARYPIVEAVTGLLFVGVYLRFGATMDSILMFFLMSVLVGITFSDLETQTIHDYFSFSGIAAGLLYGLNSGSLPGSIYGLLSGAAIFLLIRAVGWFIYKKEAMGEGDVLLAAMIGAFLGVKGLVLSVALSFLIGASVSIVLLALRLKKRGEEIPFGPYLAVSAVIAVFWGEQLWRWYLGY